MNCKNCGEKMDDGEKFCQNCGAMVKNYSDNNYHSMNDNSLFNDAFKKSSAKINKLTNNTNSSNNELPSYIKLKFASAFISFFGAIFVMFSSIGDYAMKNSYGGDAYTGIQQAGAISANNIRALSTVCKNGFIFILLTLGFFMLSVALNEKEEFSKNNK